MSITIWCSNCHRALKVSDRAAGRRVQCSNCQHVIDVKSSASEVLDDDDFLSMLETSGRNSPQQSEYDDYDIDDVELIEEEDFEEYEEDSYSVDDEELFDDYVYGKSTNKRQQALSEYDQDDPFESFHETSLLSRFKIPLLCCFVLLASVGIVMALIATEDGKVGNRVVNDSLPVKKRLKQFNNPGVVVPQKRPDFVVQPQPTRQDSVSLRNGVVQLNEGMVQFTPGIPHTEAEITPQEFSNSEQMIFSDQKMMLSAVSRDLSSKEINEADKRISGFLFALINSKIRQQENQGYSVDVQTTGHVTFEETNAMTCLFRVYQELQTTSWHYIVTFVYEDKLFVFHQQMKASGSVHDQHLFKNRVNTFQQSIKLQ